MKAGKRLLIVVFVFALASLLWPTQSHTSEIRAAPGKGGVPIDLSRIESLALDEEAVKILALSDLQIELMLAGTSYDFVHAVRLGEGEALAWRAQGCAYRNCAHVTFYDYDNGGTVEAIVNLTDVSVVSRWVDPTGRPAPSENVMPTALDIASGEPSVGSILGDIRSATPIMVPMPIWLTDDPCSNAWCVDLTYLDPEGSGRIFHVVVNMEAGTVARTFYSRSRPDRVFKRPVQQAPFEDGCHKQDGWEVCWEMTAHDGLNFQDATFRGKRVFSSAKIGQTEVWYPSWPGGYRDEIGFRASVPPHFGTEVVQLDNGFEIRQLYSEFLRWPNCICCYRYEQILRFFDDATLEFAFISHGPGCEDLSTYRPFWRIELNHNNNNGDELWAWGEDQWLQLEQEQELDLFSHLGPAGQMFATLDGDVSYRWSALPTDPLGLDEAKLFVLKSREGEGDGPITTGPANTYRPPGQWLDEESLRDEDITLWYIPVLNSKHVDPFWCVPDPEPDFSPCDAVLRVEAMGELQQPEDEFPPTPRPRPTSTPRPTAVATRDLDAPPPSIEGSDAQSIIAASGCVACHLIGKLGEADKVGPDLSYINLIAGGRVAGMSAEGYIEQSIIDPNIYLAPQCPNGDCLSNVMPRDYGERLSAEQLAVLIDYLMELDTEPPYEIETPQTLEGAQEPKVTLSREVDSVQGGEGADSGQPAKSVTVLSSSSISREMLLSGTLVLIALVVMVIVIVVLRRL